MRPIEFRGKRKDNGEWVYGDRVSALDGTFILERGNNILFQEPEYHTSGMRCGLEDRDIFDRYDAMYHGWEKALDRVVEGYAKFIEVLPDTVGQYTGRCDDKQIKIYTDDILKFLQHLGIKCGIVFYNEEMAAFCVTLYNYFNNCICENVLLHDYMASEDDHVLILGNIHDNKDILNTIG